MTVEEDFLDRLVERDRLELTETRRLSSLDDDQAADRVRLEARDLDYGVELFDVQAIEIADIRVQSPDRDDGPG